MDKTYQLIENETNVIMPTQYESKYQEIVERLDNELFGELNEENTTETRANGQVVKKRANKNDILPYLSTMQVATKLNECLRVYRPLSLDEIKGFEPSDLLNGFNIFMKLVSYINKYITYVPNRQFLCSFIGITTQTYLDLANEQSYAPIIQSCEDYFIDLNFQASQSSLVDTNATIAKLQATGNIGHSMKKADQTVVINNKFQVDRKTMLEDIRKMQNQIGGK